MRIVPYAGNFAVQTTNALNNSNFIPKSHLEKAIAILRVREPLYVTYANYYEGEHDLRINIEKMRNTFGFLFKEFSDNLCPTVIESILERLEVIGFTVESEDKDTEIPLPIHSNDFNIETNPINNGNGNGTNRFENGQLNIETVKLPQKELTIADKAWNLWRECRMKQVQTQIHLEALLCGDSYVVIWPNPKIPSKICVHPQKASQFYIEDDPETHLPLYAAKVWNEGKRRYVTLYYEDRLEKYISIEKRNDPKKDTDFEHLLVEGEEWPLENPFQRVPAFRFPHKSRMGGMGRSELKDVIPLQDALNKAMMDLMVGMEYAALRQRWATGIEIPVDPLTGEEVKTFESGIDKLWHTAAKDAHFGEFAAADLNSFIQVHDSLRLEMARVSRTPLHYFTVQTGNAPSGAALRTIEKPLVAKCEAAQTEFGDVWEDVAEFMLLVAGEINVLGQSQMESHWKPARSEDEKEDLETAALKKEIGVSETQVLTELGYSQQQIQKMQAEKAAKGAADNRQMQEDVLTAFDRGNNPGANVGNGNGSRK